MWIDISSYFIGKAFFVGPMPLVAAEERDMRQAEK